MSSSSAAQMGVGLICEAHVTWFCLCHVKLFGYFCSKLFSLCCYCIVLNYCLAGFDDFVWA